MFTKEQIENLKKRIKENKKHVIDNEEIVGYDYVEGNSDAYDCALAMIERLENGETLELYGE